MGEVNQALKHQFAYNLRDPYFGVVTRGQCLASPDSKSFTQFRGWLAMMFGSWGKCTKAVSTTSAAVSSKEIGGDTLKDQYLSHNSCRCQDKTNTHAAEIATVRLELDEALEENQKIKKYVQPGTWLVEAMTKAVSIMTVKEHLKTLQVTQYKGTSCYIGRLRQPQLACGTNGTLGGQYNLPLLYGHRAY